MLSFFLFLLQLVGVASTGCVAAFLRCSAFEISFRDFGRPGRDKGKCVLQFVNPSLRRIQNTSESLPGHRRNNEE